MSESIAMAAFEPHKVTVDVNADAGASAERPSFDAIEARIEDIDNNSADGRPAVADLLRLGEQVLEHWIVARGEMPTLEIKEGFRLLALHRQGARGEPSFNACRETCRELAYHHNLVNAEPTHPDGARRVMLAKLVAKHLCLFVSAKMQVAGIGEFCCAAKPVRELDDKNNRQLVIDEI